MDQTLRNLESAFTSDGRRVPLMPWQILALFAGVQDQMTTIGTAAQKATEQVENARLAASDSTFVPAKFSVN